MDWGQLVVFTQIGCLVLFLIPPGLVMLRFWRRACRRKEETKIPFVELPRRPAGEGARLRAAELDGRIDEWLLGLVIIPVFFAFGLILKPDVVVLVAGILASVAYSSFAYCRLSALLEKRSAYQLGFEGERYVAEELNQLMAEGFRVFHDVPFGNHNVDHVIVGRSGVFSVETKTRRKRAIDGRAKHKVTFDGTRLQFPSGYNTEWLDQSRLNAKTLSKWLRSATAEPVTAIAVLTIPGWWIDRTGRSDVHVLNPAEIRGVVANGGSMLFDDKQVQRIAHQLAEKCKLSME